MQSIVGIDRQFGVEWKETLVIHQILAYYEYEVFKVLSAQGSSNLC